MTRPQEVNGELDYLSRALERMDFTSKSVADLSQRIYDCIMAVDKNERGYFKIEEKRRLYIESLEYLQKLYVLVLEYLKGGYDKLAVSQQGIDPKVFSFKRDVLKGAVESTRKTTPYKYIARIDKDLDGRYGALYDRTKKLKFGK